MDAAALPLLREELAVYPGPVGRDGAPSWTLHDPLSNRFFRIGWPAFEILSRWHLGEPAAIRTAIETDTVLEVDEDDILGVAEFLARSQLLKADSPGAVDRLLSIHQSGKSSWLTWLLHHYLFFRVPLVRPDAWLGRTLPWVTWLGSRGFRLATLLALLVGLLLIGRQWQSFTATFVDHFSITGLAAFGIALGLAKICHELGHAYTAKAFNCRVPTMGVAFLVLWPMLYTDVNEAWKLNARRQRLLVGGAGILAELTIAAWASLAWGLLPDGTARSMAFTLAATTWISSLAINLSPFMRFDGYFLAMDTLDQPNLHPRSFALARWHLRETLFGLGEPMPEHLPPRTHLGMIVFAWGVWLYRLILFLGIAVLVYHFFIKLVGIILFMVEIGWFVVKPVWAEIREWKKRLPAIRAGRRVRWPLAVLLGGLLLLVVPWNGKVTAPALLKAQEYSLIYVPFGAVLREVTVKDGDRVEAGAVLARLDNPDAEHRRQQLDSRVAALRYELSATGMDSDFRARSQSIAEELRTAQAERAALANEQDRLELLAPMDGIVTDSSPLVQPGQWINQREPLLGLRQGGVLEAYVAEEDVPRLRVGASAYFIPEGRDAGIDATITAIDRVAVTALTEPSLAVPYGGTIPARFDHNNLVPDVAVYRLRLKPVDDRVVPPVPLRGQVRMDGDYRSPLGHGLRAIAAVLLREWGL
ncbi:HlyD family efflux transporter periplasmic adaptor subunit [Magnetospirillum gryphiswaldense]|uniref:Peptidase family M50 n=1 Tax=Magnetospirillum gryphiswaldense TaxID=55518 RepID=A4TXI7_9PROT|nr:HlyD family efflux transporter periplasmic adaptor subunit [Magnetospirillum gryphiswaldense]AVM75446.1 HlyD family secretion protein [Magnetospirillum gryphiswaldense MSR-1]AVM79349.1 HlyD family secretion protein [Magnetospirillum gryphiswaldense]CAM75344.1 peptidase family M50 [Magnetospirillum gryphiswaldense MSR-1]